MVNFYVLTFHGSDKRYCYTSIETLCYAHTYDELGIGKDWLSKRVRNDLVYINEKIKVEKYTALNKTDIKKRRQQDT